VSALLGRDPHGSAAMVLLVGKSVVLVWLCVVLLDGYERIQIGVMVIALSLLCLAAYATVQSIQRGTIKEFNRVTQVRGPGGRDGPFSDNNDLARVLAAAVPLWWLLGGSKEKRGWRRAIAYLGCAGTAIGVACTFSRGGFLAVMTAIATVLRYYFTWPLVALLMVLLLGVILTVAPRAYSRRIISIVVPADTSFQQRIQVWDTGLAGLRSDPLLGRGPGMFCLSKPCRTSHNIFIEVLVEGGLIGLAAYVWGLAATFRALSRCRAPNVATDGTRRAAFAMTASLLAYLVASLALGGAYHTRIFELVGLALALDASDDDYR
jgi:O-antigen ligase